jgi:hypothetical protein
MAPQTSQDALQHVPIPHPSTMNPPGSNEQGGPFGYRSFEPSAPSAPRTARETSDLILWAALGALGALLFLGLRRLNERSAIPRS